MINIGILGAGIIAGTMAETITSMMKAGNKDVCLYAVSSRSKDKAQSFAEKWNIPHAFGSYEAMLADESLDLVYIATPHSHHAQHIELCLNNGKHILCEKAFTVNAEQARTVCALAKEKKLLLAEAIWTRYQPMRDIINETLASGIVGSPRMLTANLGYSMRWKERIVKPELAGGALLDVGVYAINFACMVFGIPSEIKSYMLKNDAGVDMQDSMTLVYPDKLAVLCSSAENVSDRYGIIHCDNGFVQVENINNPQKLTVYDASYRVIKELPCPKQFTGYEYEVQECCDTIKAGCFECPSMPHADTIKIMELMDTIRSQNNLVYPFEK